MKKQPEIDRIKEAYARRKDKVPAERYSFFNPTNLFMVQERDRKIIETFKRFGIDSLGDKKILDIGCGEGSEMRNLIRYGARPENLHGVDLLPYRIEAASALSPNIDFRCCSAETLPFADELFDIVIQFTVFTSILDYEMKRRIAREMVRVLRPEGIILWYDYHMNNPQNPDVRGVKKKEIFKLFPGYEIYLKRITLAPPLTRRIAPYSWITCYLLEKCKVLNTHYLGVIRKCQH
jgi:ubiquinone/menaquinone biosynthesis C-methylase UbiE